MLVRNAVCLVTGAASGIGRGVGEFLVKSGAKVVLTDLQSAPLEEHFGPSTSTRLVQEMDIRSEEQVQSALDVCQKHFGGLHVLVNCAGASCAYQTYNFNQNLPHTLDDFERIVNTNLIGTFNVVRLAVPLLAQNEAKPERGVIILTSGLQATQGQRNQAVFSSTCGGINAMTLPLARELAQKSIRVNTIAPGVFLSNMTDHIPEDFNKLLCNMMLSPARFGAPDDFAHLVRAIIQNTYLNGSIIELNAGFRSPP